MNSTGYRAKQVADAGAPPPPRTQPMRDLERAQKKMTEALSAAAAARHQRDELLDRLWREGNAQSELAARLDRADRRAGGSGVTTTAVQKALHRYNRNGGSA